MRTTLTATRQPPSDYPLLLQYIIETNPGRKWYMLVDQQNVASQRGIAKINFIKYGEGIRNRWGRYVRCR